MNIIETAVSNGSFKTLVAAVKAADLEDALTSEGPFFKRFAAFVT
jgi:uncharacterized surface protein with fasciclin (FAS1) repeats